MRQLIPAVLALGFSACSSSPHNTPDSATPDTPPDVDTGGTPITITNYKLTGPVNSALLAVQDGEGPWHAVTGTAGVYSASIHADHFGITIGCVDGTGNGSIFTLHAALSQGTAWYFEDCGDLPATATVTGTVTGAATADAMQVMNGFDAADIAAGTTAYTLSTSVGPTRVIAQELVGNRPIKLAMTDTTITDGAVVNLDLAAGFAPVTRALAMGTATSASLWYRDAHVMSRLDHGTALTTYRAIPADKLGSGLNRLSVSGSTSDASQSVIRYFKDPVDQTVALPPVLTLPQQPTATAAPYPTVTATLPVQAGTTMYDLYYSTNNQTTGRSWTVEVTGAWVDKAHPGASTFAYAMPDLHALPGWQATFQLEGGQPISTQLGTTTSVNVDLFYTLPAPQFAFHDGGETKVVSIIGQLAAP